MYLLEAFAKLPVIAIPTSVGSGDLTIEHARGDCFAGLSAEASAQAWLAMTDQLFKGFAKVPFK
jgi:hypothetical protein